MGVLMGCVCVCAKKSRRTSATCAASIADTESMVCIYRAICGMYCLTRRRSGVISAITAAMTLIHSLMSFALAEELPIVARGESSASTTLTDGLGVLVTVTAGAGFAVTVAVCAFAMVVPVRAVAAMTLAAAIRVRVRIM